MGPQANHVKDVIGHFETILRNGCDSFQLIRLIALILVQNSLCVHQKSNKNFIFSILPETPVETGIKMVLIQSSNNHKADKTEHIYFTVYFAEKAKTLFKENNKTKLANIVFF